jgi:hypothetical protein
MRNVWVLLVCLGLILPVAAQSQAPFIQSGETLTLELSASAMQELRFSAQAGELFSLSVVGVGEARYEGAGLGVPTDPTFTLLSPEGLALKYVDDTPQGALASTGTTSTPQVPSVSQEAHLRNFVLPQTGDYVLRLDSFSGVTDGAIEVTLSLSPAEPMALDWAEASAEGRLTHRLDLAPHQSGHLSLSLRAGETLRLLAQDMSGRLDPRLQVLDESGAVLADNDDAPAEWLIAEGLDVLDAGLDFSAPADGIYHLHLSDYLGRAGELALQIKRG